MIILASKSPRRRMLLSEAGISFRCIPADIIEKTSCIRPSFRVRDLARQKAEAVAELNPEMPVLGSDTLVYCKGEILGKPADTADALRMLKMQNGSWQSVYTGVAVVWKKKKLILSATAVSHCKARKLPEEELEKIARKHLDKAGAYAVQDKDDQFIEKTEGSFDTIVGLPVFLVKELLTKAGIKEDGSYE
ncbi:MAG: septum formation protein Maf [Elusimicrobiales bacterium]|jgi:septum formation protein|nr:septum formation protein Maf [Elusimicrobiales bacterium]